MITPWLGTKSEYQQLLRPRPAGRVAVKGGIAASCLVHRVAGNRETGAGDTVFGQVGQSLLNGALWLRIQQGNLLCLPPARRSRTRSNQTLNVRKAVQFFIGNVVQVVSPAESHDNSVNQTRVLIW